MEWPVLEYSRSQVNRAGDILRADNPDDRQLKMASLILNNWRSCHGYPLNTFQATLRDKLKKVDPDAIVAQRLKRTPSIISKLRRLKGMELSRMQDIGGLRAVVNTLENVRMLEQNYKDSKFMHELVTERDYIQAPKSSGYRSVHMIYRYRNDRNPIYDGLLIELQIRTRLQHAWATAVETMGTFLEYALKSSEGPKEWLNFFSLTGSGFAHLENCPPLEEHVKMSKDQVFRKITKKAAVLNVRQSLQAFTVVVDSIIDDDRHGTYYYHLIVLNPVEKTVQIRSYGRERLEEANKDYSEEELRIKKGEPIQVVLVSAGPIDALKRAYPNYFLDTHEFLKLLGKIEKKAREL